jgi:hypothetical protein
MTKSAGSPKYHAPSRPARLFSTSVPPLPKKTVVAVAARQHLAAYRVLVVIRGNAAEGVEIIVAGAAEQLVSAGFADEEINTAVPIGDVVAGTGKDDVGARGDARNLVEAGRGCGRHRGGG